MDEYKIAGEPVFSRCGLARRLEGLGYFGPILVAWLFAAGFLIVFVTFRVAYPSPVWGPDDAMRLVQVRDFLGGQGWYDLSQFRLDPGHDFVMHWSRIIDLPLAIWLVVLGSVTEISIAERVTLFVWPLALLFALIWVSARLAMRIGGRKSLWTGVLLPVLALGTLGEYLPGRIDHHGAQIVLTLCLLLLILDGHKDIRSAVLAGVTCPLILAIGLEPMPFILAATGAVALRWIIDGQTVRQSMVVFGSSIALAAPTIFFITVPEARYSATACDAFSPAHLYALVTGGGCFVLLGLFSHKLGKKRYRAVAAGLVCCLVVGLIGLTYPECLTDPYGQLDPKLKTNWLHHVIEAQSASSLIARAPEQLLQYYLMPIAGLAVCIGAFARARGSRRFDWVVLFAFISLGLAYAIYQVRGAKFAFVLSIPAGAWLIGVIYDRYRTAAEAHRSQWLAGLLTACFLFSGAFHQGASAEIGRVARSERSIAQAQDRLSNPSRACRSTSTLKPLNDFEPGLILAPRNLGAHLLLETHHSVLAANYHRNHRGLLLALDILNESGAIAHNRVKENKVRYLLHCPGLVDKRSDGRISADALALRLDRKEDPPPWLEPVRLAPNSPLKLYRVR